MLSLCGSWLSYKATIEELRSQLLQRAYTLGTAIDEAIKIARNDVEIHFAVENIIKKETGISGITVATKDPFVIWASSFHPKIERDLMTQNMLSHLKPSIKQGIFGYHFNRNGDLEILFPLSSTLPSSTPDTSPSINSFASQEINPLLLKSNNTVEGYQYLSEKAYRGSIHMVFDWSEIQKSSAGLFWFSILTILAGITIFTILATYILYKTVLKPVNIISEVIQKQYKGERNARIPTLGQDEIGELGLTFNNMLNAMIESEEKFKSLTENTQDLIMRYDRNCCHLYMNPSALKLFDLNEINIINKNHQQLGFEKELIDFFENKITTVFKTGKPLYTVFDWNSPEGQVNLDWRLFPEHDENNNITTVLGISRDISELKQKEKKIQYQAHYDSLTGIPNRFLSLDRLSQLINEAKRSNTKIAILFIDLDDFKTINDSLGHGTGDKVLIEAGQRLSNEVRRGDTVGRLGGDEFIVLLDNLSDKIDAAIIAKNLLNEFKTVFRIDNRELMITASIGIAIFPSDGDNSSELLRNADSAMYHAKKLGRNTFCYYTDEMNREVLRRLVLEEQMHGALERGEFKVFYQPKAELDTGLLMGAEALLRWHNPVLGIVSPEEFVVIAEQTGLIVPIGRFVLTEALKMTAQWHQNFNKSFHLAVNVSPRQFRDPDFVGFVETTMQDFNMNPKFMEIEITEGVLMNGYSYINETLNALSNLGLSIAMDDFGTGYSTLSYLRSYPFNVLKVDRSFIHDITTNEADRELIIAAIAMAHGLKLKVVAEGIETEEQLSYLKQLNCDYGQGYLFSKPLSALEMTKLLEPKQKSVGNGFLEQNIRLSTP